MRIKFTQDKEAQQNLFGGQRTAPLQPGRLRETDTWSELSPEQQRAVEAQSQKYWDTFQDLPPDRQQQERARPGSVMTIPQTYQLGGQQVTTRPREQHPDAIRGWQLPRPVSGLGRNPAHQTIERLAAGGPRGVEGPRSKFQQLADQVLQEQFQQLPRNLRIGPDRRTGFHGYGIGPQGANLVYGTNRGMDRLRLEPEDIQGELTRENVQQAARRKMQQIREQVGGQPPEQEPSVSAAGPRGYEAQPTPEDRARKRQMVRNGGSWWDQIVNFFRRLFS